MIEQQMGKRNEDNSVNQKKKWTEKNILIAGDSILNNVEESRLRKIECLTIEFIIGKSNGYFLAHTIHVNL